MGHQKPKGNSFVPKFGCFKPLPLSTATSKFPRFLAFPPKMAKQSRGSSTQRHRAGRGELAMPFRLNVGRGHTPATKVKGSSKNIDRINRRCGQQFGCSKLASCTNRQFPGQKHSNFAIQQNGMKINVWSM